MLVGKPILSGDSDVRQLELIFDLVGTPTEENMPGWMDLPGAEGLSPRPRPNTISQRFREYVFSSSRMTISNISVDTVQEPSPF